MCICIYRNSLLRLLFFFSLFSFLLLFWNGCRWRQSHMGRERTKLRALSFGKNLSIETPALISLDDDFGAQNVVVLELAGQQKATPQTTCNADTCTHIHTAHPSAMHAHPPTSKQPRGVRASRLRFSKALRVVLGLSLPTRKRAAASGVAACKVWLFTSHSTHSHAFAHTLACTNPRFCVLCFRITYAFALKRTAVSF
jgi:hypothetical protein